MIAVGGEIETRSQGMHTVLPALPPNPATAAMVLLSSAESSSSRPASFPVTRGVGFFVAGASSPEAQANVKEVANLFSGSAKSLQSSPTERCQSVDCGSQRMLVS